ncbi:2-oxo acid dehydrogenase subunit E2 [Bacillus paranthracis]
MHKKAREGSLSSDDMQGTTFTISNLGSFGIEYFTPVLNTPETGILGVGAIEHVPVYKGKKIKKRQYVTFKFNIRSSCIRWCTSNVHFLRTIKRYLEEPVTILFIKRR